MPEEFERNPLVVIIGAGMTGILRPQLRDKNYQLRRLLKASQWRATYGPNGARVTSAWIAALLTFATPVLR